MKRNIFFYFRKEEMEWKKCKETDRKREKEN